jgi:hypothetical protein
MLHQILYFSFFSIFDVLDDFSNYFEKNQLFNCMFSNIIEFETTKFQTKDCVHSHD